jgi:hypothetical protein
MSLDLVDIKAKIESWNKFHQIGALRILSAREKSKLNENRNGIFVNLSCISDETRQELLSYISYVDEQVSQLELGENAMDQMKNALRKDDKASPY